MSDENGKIILLIQTMDEKNTQMFASQKDLFTSELGRVEQTITGRMDAIADGLDRETRARKSSKLQIDEALLDAKKRLGVLETFKMKMMWVVGIISSVWSVGIGLAVGLGRAWFGKKISGG